MLYEALHSVIETLDEHLKKTFRQKEEKALLGGLLDIEGGLPERHRNKVLLSVVNLQEETVRPYGLTYVPLPDRKRLKLAQPYDFNVDLLLAAVFEDYDESLKFLSAALYFFQGKPPFPVPGTAEEATAKHLSFELVKLSYQEMHSLWTALGAKYVPSVLLKMRMLSVQSGKGEVVAEIEGITPAGEVRK
ncbi:MAG: Pvc16 family protein [Bacteroidota bacterium]